MKWPNVLMWLGDNQTCLMPLCVFSGCQFHLKTPSKNTLQNAGRNLLELFYVAVFNWNLKWGFKCLLNLHLTVIQLVLILVTWAYLSQILTDFTQIRIILYLIARMTSSYRTRSNYRAFSSKIQRILNSRSISTDENTTLENLNF